MRKLENLHLVVMLILLCAVGQMAQTIYVPTVADIAQSLAVPASSVPRVMAAYLLTYGFSQLFYGPLSDRVGRKPVILVGMSIFIVGSLIALFAQSLELLIIASAIQGMGTGVGGVMARTLPRDLYNGSQLRQANSLLNMGILISPLLAPMLGGLLAMAFGWRACFAFMLIFCCGITACIWHWLPETRPQETERRNTFSLFYRLLSDGNFRCYLLMLVGALAGIAVFEASSGALLGAGLGLSSMTVSVLFILPIPAAFFGAWYAGRDNKSFHHLMWQSVVSCLLAGLMMWVPSWFGIMSIWTLIVPAALFFFGAGMLFPLATSGKSVY